MNARCAHPGCQRFIAAGVDFCHRHDPTAAAEAGASASAPAVAPAPAAAPSIGDRAAEFERRLNDGHYRELFGAKLAGVMTEAAAVAGVDDEIGALRYVLAKLIAEEADPAKLAQGVARVAAVSIQAAKAQRLISGALANGLTDAVTAVLLELDHAD